MYSTTKAHLVSGEKKEAIIEIFWQHMRVGK
jgi:hypothetical protein